ncbi:MAG: SLC45 family MFS transporter [Erysipelothrix sp.]|nr:SLC45 family MFS transporter [Erysipelothrix sp.]
MKLNTKRTLLVGIAFMSISSFWQLYDFVIPLITKNEFMLSESMTGVVMALDNILALVMLPIFGIISDKTITKYGRRMPFIVIGTILTIIGMLMLPYTATQGNLLLFFVALGIMLLSIAIYRSPAVALMPDVTMKPLRSKGNAIINLMGAIGGVVALLFISQLSPEKMNSYYPVFLAVALFMGIGLVLMVSTIRENKWAKEMHEESLKYGVETEEVKAEVGAELEKPVKRSLSFVLLSIALWFMGYNAVTSTFSRYATSYIGFTESQASMVLLIANVGAIVSFIPIGNISSKVGRKKMITVGIVLLTFAFGSSTLYTSYSPLMIGNFLLAGFAWASINVNSLPMVLQMSRDSDVGRYTGLYYSFSMAAQIITPILSGFLIDQLGFGILFPYAAFFVAFALVTMSQVKHGDTTIGEFIK